MDVKELQRGLDLTRREFSMHGHNSLLKDFIHHNEARLKKLLDDARIAQVEKKNLSIRKTALGKVVGLNPTRDTIHVIM